MPRRSRERWHDAWAGIGLVVVAALVFALVPAADRAGTETSEPAAGAPGERNAVAIDPDGASRDRPEDALRRH